MAVARQLVTVPIKPISESKTVWVAAITIIVGVLVWAGVINPASWGPDKIDGIVGTILSVVGAINMILRLFFTAGPTTLNTNTSITGGDALR